MITNTKRYGAFLNLAINNHIYKYISVILLGMVLLKHIGKVADHYLKHLVIITKRRFSDRFVS
jgi:predicted RNA-binding protein with RPS1 domain